MDKQTVTDQPPPYSAMPPGPQPQMYPHMYPQSYPQMYPQMFPQPYTQPVGRPGALYPPPMMGYTSEDASRVTGYNSSYGPAANYIQPPLNSTGNCPACRVGPLEEDYTFLGLMCAILLFPIGIICCYALKNRRCLNCGATFG